MTILIYNKYNFVLIYEMIEMAESEREREREKERERERD